MGYREYDQKRLRLDERYAVMKLDMLTRSFCEAVKVLEKRLQGNGYRYGKRDARMMESVCGRIERAALGNMRDDDEVRDLAASILRQSRDFRLGLERWKPTTDVGEVVMPLEHEWQLIHIALESRCAFCMHSGDAAQRCKIRKMLRCYCDEPDPGLMECGYKGCDLSDNAKLNRPERL